jgi:hypothetical protein
MIALTSTKAATRTTIVYLLVGIKLSHDRTYIHNVTFFSEDGSKQRWRCYIGGISGFLHE